MFNEYGHELGFSIISSIFLKGPFFWRYSTMRVAVRSPVPGSCCSSVAPAVLMLTMSEGLAVSVTGWSALTATPMLPRQAPPSTGLPSRMEP
jgi:hypothetical protein